MRCMTQGAELGVLKTIDWTRTRIDVICIETDAAHRPSAYVDKIVAYMDTKGFVNVTTQGRNTCPSTSSHSNASCLRLCIFLTVIITSFPVPSHLRIIFN